MKRMLCHLVVVAAAMLLSNVAHAGVIGDFEVEAFGSFTLVDDTVEIDAAVTDQTPDLGFESFLASLLLDLEVDPFTFAGDFTLTGADGDLFATTTGVLFIDGAFVVQAGTFMITGGTGVFDGLTGSGVINGFSDLNTGEQQVKLAGTIVPAPAALALFGVAGLVTRRRRRV